MKRFLAILILMILPVIAMAQGLPERFSATLNDFANVLSDEERQRLEDRLTELRAVHETEVVLVTMQRKSDYLAGTELEGFARNLFDTWGIGDARRNDGVLLLYLQEDREVRIELGAGYGQDWNRAADIVVDDFLVPNFRAGRTAVGLEKGVTSIRDEIVVPFRAGGEPRWLVEERGAQDAAPGFLDGLLQSPATWALGFFAVAGIGLSLGRGRLRRCPNCGRRGGLTVSKIYDTHFPVAGRRTGIKRRSCRHCDFKDETAFAQHANRTGGGGSGGRNSRSGGRSGGGSRGGRSGGGGSSGRW